MKKIEEIRRDNLQRLRDELGSVKQLVEVTGKSQSQISQWLNGSAHSVTGKPRVISSGACREIEKATGKPDGWMDVEQTSLTLVEPTEATALRKLLNETSSEIRLLSVYRLASADQRELIDGAVRLVIEQLDIPALFSVRK
jgi:transcriptional regulator with XRE-family HTH domain